MTVVEYVLQLVVFIKLRNYLVGLVEPILQLHVDISQLCDLSNACS